MIDTKTAFVHAPRWLWTAYFSFMGIRTVTAAHFGGMIATGSDTLAALLTATLMAYTIYDDSGRRGGLHRFSYATWALVLWPVLGPLYLFETRGWRGIGLLLLFVALFFASFVLPTLFSGQGGFNP